MMAPWRGESRRPARRRRQGGAGPARHGSCSLCGLHVHAPLHLLTHSAWSLPGRGALGGRAYPGGRVSPPRSGRSRGTAVPQRQDERKVQRTRDLSLPTAGTRCRGPGSEGGEGGVRAGAQPESRGGWWHVPRAHGDTRRLISPPAGSSETGRVASTSSTARHGAVLPLELPALPGPSALHQSFPPTSATVGSRGWL